MEHENFNFQQEKVPLDWKKRVRANLNESLPEKLIGRGGDEDSFFIEMAAEVTGPVPM